MENQYIYYRMYGWSLSRNALKNMDFDGAGVDRFPVGRKSRDGMPKGLRELVLSAGLGL